MNLFTNRFAAWTAVAALSAVSLFAAETGPARFHRHGRGAFLANYLQLTPAQRSQEKAIFQSARQSAQPLRQQLKQTRQSMQAAIQANDSAQIQQLATAEGNELGQLAAVRGNAKAKMYQILTPDQQQKIASLRQSWRSAHRHRRGAQAPAAGQQN